MKKQFNRMRQLANQTVGRAEKTEVLSDDLLQIERRLELVRMVSHNTHKRLVSCLQGQLGTDTEKRHKKLPLTMLSQAMQEGGSQLGDEGLIGKMMDVCGEAESRLATELMQHEVQLERDILDPLNQLAEVDIPNILKQRKQLAKLVLDYDSAKTRWYQATKSNNQAMAAKADSLKDEMDEALNKVEICKDQLSADLYNFASKEGDYARYYVMLLEAQADYHRRSLAALEAAIPNIQIQQDTWMEKPAFGTALEEHLKRSNREIALPIEACVMMLLETGMKEEGLFRIAAGASKLKKLKAALDCSTSQLEEFYSDPHAVAGALKSYLRELPEPLMTFSLYDEWIQASNVSDPDKRLQALWVTCDGLPKTHKANFRYLVKFLAKLAQDSEVNKMTPSNIAIVLGPNLLWAKTEGTLAEMAAATSVHVVAIIEPIIQHADWFFPEEVDFNVSGMFAMPTHPATPDPEPGLERKRPGSLVGQDGDSHTPRKDSTVNKQPEPTPRRASTVNRKQPQLTSPTFQPPLPPLEAGGPAQPEPQPQLSSPATEAEQPGLSGASSGGGVGGGLGGGVQVATVQPQIVTQLSAEESSPAREVTSTPPPQRNGSVHLSVGTPHSQGGSRGPSPHMVRRGTKKQAPAPPKQFSPFASQPSNTQTSGSHHPPITPRRHQGKDSPIHAPSHPPPQPPQAHQAQGESEPSPPSTPTPPDTPPHDGSQSNPLSYHSGSLPRPSRPAPRPRPRPSMPPPPQPAANDNGNGLFGSASKIITDV
ncbi:rho GTPase-activating protein 17b isoform X2 [Epinephelus lanceolatus]|uniref:rho GTPase-activating protein 17b isoform X2 n=1 Tax=Epinephelus lanceolatus TaxID=310571 RepID=UPI001446C0B3|nr:rho GTPase-activating protein 17b isoform X2 [Epinephelus lanceolatus]XP_033500159.1 rho GTPase-activating protein 17b isoform X2 [Epinephelus lanceolatus]XP_033500160.1 rho GTPase-activating protein 17b isoform X2 [Epinephelus lanceolatus]XP_049924452.1 rho GTPase-activating protein 17b isoform X2 [Epinephelus moara]XP_049924453.1 rho GTPase-activating protein 17b isoform X2 [Epinephelus moara]XP_049924454.1 rho GTPase-activating protein 17b isoform X2 [Epinephelus moara]